MFLLVYFYSCVCAYLYIYVWVPMEALRGRVGACEPLDVGTLELNSGPLEEQNVLLTIKPFLQPLGNIIF